MRLRLLLALCAVVGAASPSQAETPAGRLALARNTMNCNELYSSRRYAQSLIACEAAAAGFDKAATEENNPWYAYYRKATILTVEASDQSALGHHRAAERSAIAAHRLASYVYTSYKLDADDYTSINALVAQLQRIEAQEQAYIRRSEGD